MKVGELTSALIKSAEKGANIARIIRSESTLLELLVQEKTGSTKNRRFVQDFKTLADVLVQELVRHDLSVQFPGIERNVRGEESNRFTNTLGEKLCVEVKNSQEETCAMLGKVLDGDDEAASLLADAIHADCPIELDSRLQDAQQNLNIHDIGIWIDPIDSTAQYINGIVGDVGEDGLVIEGLQCVVVLIGAYSQRTGLPIIGVANQPFSHYDADNKKWSGHHIWGICCDQFKMNSLTTIPPSCQMTDPDSPLLTLPHIPKIITSPSESPHIQEFLQKHMTVIHSAGAGYKVLATVEGLVQAYLLSKDTTYNWDTCAPHAILRSSGGGIVNFKQILADFTSNGKLVNGFEKFELVYNCDNDGKTGADVWANIGGIVAFSDIRYLHQILHTLSYNLPG